MNQSIKNNVHYDKKFDVLSVKFSCTKNSYGDEETDNIIFLKDFNDDKITGLTILDFRKMFEMKDIRLDLISKYFNVSDIYTQYVMKS